MLSLQFHVLLLKSWDEGTPNKSEFLRASSKPLSEKELKEQKWQFSTSWGKGESNNIVVYNIYNHPVAVDSELGSRHPSPFLVSAVKPEQIW